MLDAKVAGIVEGGVQLLPQADTWW